MLPVWCIARIWSLWNSELLDRKNSDRQNMVLWFKSCTWIPNSWLNSAMVTCLSSIFLLVFLMAWTEQRRNWEQAGGNSGMLRCHARATSISLLRKARCTVTDSSTNTKTDKQKMMPEIRSTTDVSVNSDRQGYYCYITQDEYSVQTYTRLAVHLHGQPLLPEGNGEVTGHFWSAGTALPGTRGRWSLQELP